MSVKPELSNAAFECIRAQAKDDGVIIIDGDKLYLVKSRLSALADKEGFD